MDFVFESTLKFGDVKNTSFLEYVYKTIQTREWLCGTDSDILSRYPFSLQCATNSTKARPAGRWQ